MTTFYFFNAADSGLFVRNDALAAEYQHDEFLLRATFPKVEGKKIERGMRIRFKDGSGDEHACEVCMAKLNAPGNTQEIEAEHIAVAELSDEFIHTFTPTDVKASAAVTTALSGTQWSLGTAVDSGVTFAEMNDGSVWEALCAVREAWGVRIVPRVTFGESGITGRYIDVKAATEDWSGVRLSMRKNVLQAGISYDDRDVVTALYGYGKSISNGNQQNEEYERVTFASEVWTTAGGKPANKPSGQEWVEDAAATALYGRNGRKRVAGVTFSDIEDAGILLTRTWEELQKRNKPKLTIELTVVDLHAMGYGGERIRLGDTVWVEIEPDGVKVQSSVIKLKEDLLQPSKTKPTVGNDPYDLLYGLRRLKKDVEQINRDLYGSHGGGGKGKPKGGVKGVIEVFSTDFIRTDREIGMKASQELVDQQGNRLTVAESTIIAQADSITMKVSKNGVISAIRQTPETIQIQASRIDLEGYVTASQLSAEVADINKFFTGNATVLRLNASALTCDLAHITTVSLMNYACSWASKTVVTDVSLSYDMVTINGQFAVQSINLTKTTATLNYIKKASTGS